MDMLFITEMLFVFLVVGDPGVQNFDYVPMNGGRWLRSEFCVRIGTQCWEDFAGEAVTSQAVEASQLMQAGPPQKPASLFSTKAATSRAAEASQLVQAGPHPSTMPASLFSTVRWRAGPRGELRVNQ